MSERSVTIWNLVVGFSIVSIIAMSFKLFPMNKKFNRFKDRSADLQFGTDKELENIINKVIYENPKNVDAYKSGKDKLFGFFVGQVMKNSGGKANPKLVNEILKKKLN